MKSSGDCPAAFIPARCQKTGKKFFVREDLGADGMWVRTYGIVNLPESAHASSGHTTEIDLSNHRTGPQYKCPHCGTKRIFFCNLGDCEAKVCCYDGGDTWHCPITGKTGGFSSEAQTSVTGKRGKGQ